MYLLQVRFTSYSGGKSNLENFAYLPTTIMNMKNGTAEFAQWNYRYNSIALQMEHCFLAVTLKLKREFYI